MSYTNLGIYAKFQGVVMIFIVYSCIDLNSFVKVNKKKAGKKTGFSTGLVGYNPDVARAAKKPRG